MSNWYVVIDSEDEEMARDTAAFLIEQFGWDDAIHVEEDID